MRLTASDLACVRGGREVFSRLGFSAGAGEILAITGPNGVGKTSLLRTISGLVRAAAGEVVLEGGDAELSVPEQCHYLGHQDALKPSLSVLENLTFWAAYLGGGSGKTDGTGNLAPAAALYAVGLAALSDLPTAYLSAGQRRRLSIARLLAARRPVWLLDEPTSALDVAAQARLVELLRDHLRDGGIVLAATHGPLGLDTRELRLGPASTGSATTGGAA